MSKIKKCVGKESLQRMNYLFQLSNHLLTENPSKNIAALQYSNLGVNISKRAVLRLDSELKRAICKGCKTLLIPGVTCRVKIKKKKVVKHCLRCSQYKVFDASNPEYLPWNQCEESVVEVLDYGVDLERCKKVENKAGNE